MNRIAKDVSSANGTVLRGQYGYGSVIDIVTDVEKAKLPSLAKEGSFFPSGHVAIFANGCT